MKATTKTTENTATNTPATARPKAVASKKPEALQASGRDFSERPENTEPEKAVMSTDAFSKEVLTELKKREKKILDCIGKIDTSFEAIAFSLYWINAKEAFKASGFDTIVSYSDSKFGYAKTTCYSLISVVERFAKRDASGLVSEEFDPRIKGYSVSKLSLMVGLTDDQISRLTPGMSVRDIKKFVKSLEGKSIPELSEGNSEDEEDGTQDSPSDSPGMGAFIDSTAKEIIRNTLISYKGAKDYGKNADFEKINDYVLRVLNAHPDAVIEISYTLPSGKEGISE